MQLHAWYSPRQESLAGYCIYARADGERIKITEVSELDKPYSKWSDTKYLGIVETFIESQTRPLHTSMEGLLSDMHFWAAANKAYREENEHKALMN